MSPASGTRVVSVLRFVGQPDAALIDGHDCVVASQFRHQQPPGVPGLRPSVHKQERGALAAHDGVQAHLARVDVSAGEHVGEAGREIRRARSGAQALRVTKVRRATCGRGGRTQPAAHHGGRCDRGGAADERAAGEPLPGGIWQRLRCDDLRGGQRDGGGRAHGVLLLSRPDCLCAGTLRSLKASRRARARRRPWSTPWECAADPGAARARHVRLRWTPAHGGTAGATRVPEARRSLPAKGAR